MGIYASHSSTHPMYDLETGLTTWTESRSYPGYVESRTVTATEWAETERTDCFCCSCEDREGSDYLCRNHGYGFGKRPCEFHNMPGENIIDPERDVDTGVMPASVQEHRKKVHRDVDA